MVLHILGVTLLSALLFTPVIGHCQNPKVRKEWRCLNREERASWIKAVKVFLPLVLMLSTLAELATAVSRQLTARS